MLRLLVSSAGLGLLVACGTAAPTTPAPPPTSASQPTAAGLTTTQSGGSSQPKAGGRLRFGLLGDLTTLDPHVIIPGGFDTLWQVYDRLTTTIWRTA